MENTIEQNIPTQTLHLAVDIEIPSKTEFNQQTIQQAINHCYLSGEMVFRWSQCQQGLPTILW
jgi:hypothetical protein